MILEDTHVLIVEDNAQTTRLIRMMLMDMQVAHVITTADGVEAQEVLDAGEERIDVILCDWRMPRMTGIELLKIVRKSHPAIPFMMVTANADVDSIKAAASQGVSGYIAKPFSPLQLKKKLVALIDPL
jgi:CheY-like chemotaxis protein